MIQLSCTQIVIFLYRFGMFFSYNFFTWSSWLSHVLFLMDSLMYPLVCFINPTGLKKNKTITKKQKTTLNFVLCPFHSSGWIIWKITVFKCTYSSIYLFGFTDEVSLMFRLSHCDLQLQNFCYIFAVVYIYLSDFSLCWYIIFLDLCNYLFLFYHSLLETQ